MSTQRDRGRILAIPEGALQLARGVLPVEIWQRLFALPGCSAAEHRALTQQLETIQNALAAALPSWLATAAGRPHMKNLQDATLLFADVSGFTQITSYLSQRGLEGNEVLVQRINECFEVIVDAVHGSAGSVLSFGGDGLLALFAEADHAALAAGAAVDIQERFVTLAPLQLPQSTTALPFRVKIGIARGPLQLASPGLEGRHMPLALGSALISVDQLAAAAEAGEILVNQRTASALGVPMSTQRLGSTLPKGASRARPRRPSGQATGPTQPIEAVLERIVALAPHIPPAVRQELAGTLRPAPGVGEQRLTVSVFLYLGGLHALAEMLALRAPEALERILHHVIHLCMRRIDRAGGSLVRIDTYAHGHKLLALFGAPQAHEHDAERAIRSALRLCADSAAINQLIAEQIEGAGVREPIPQIQIRAGLEFGQCVVALIGSPERYEYTVMGDAVNVAARLMGIANLDSGEVLIGPRLYELVRAALDPVEPRVVPLKGKGPTSIYPVAQIRSRSWRTISSMPLLGRDHELGQLRGAIDALVRGMPSAVILQGEAGIGKTRLRQAFLAQVRPHARCIIVNAPGEAAPSYAALRDALQQLCEIGGDADAHQARRTLQDTLDAHGLGGDSLLSSALGYLLGIPIDLQTVLGTSADARARLLAQQLHRLLTACAAARPIAWFVEDLHVVDGESLALLDQLFALEWRSPILFCLTLRPGSSGQRHDSDRVTPQQICRSARAKFPETAVQINLPPLAPSDGQSLIDHLLPGLSAHARDTLVGQARGNPLFLELLAQQVLERGALRADASGMALELTAPLDELDMPTTLRSLALEQIDSLSTGARQVAKAAAVLGAADPTIDLQILEGLLESHASLELHIRELEDAQICERAGPSGQEHILFRHPIFQTAATQLLQIRERRLLHQRAANELERRAHPDEQTEALAHHYYEAQEWRSALRCSLLAGQRAVAQYLPIKARRWLLRALRLARRLSAADEELRARVELGDICALNGRWDVARSQLERARARLDAHDHDDTPTELLARCLRLLALVQERTAGSEADYDQADALYQQGLAAAHRRADASLESGRINVLRAEALWRRGRLAQAEHACLIGLRGLGATPEEMWLRISFTQRLAMIAGQRGHYERAIRGLRESLDLARQLGDPNLTAQILNNLGLHSIHVGAASDAVDNLNESLAIKQQIGDTVGMVRTLENLGLALLNVGDLDAAEIEYQKCRALCLRLQIRQSLANVTVNLGHLFYLRQELEKAQTMLEEAQAIYASLGDPDSLADCAYRLGDVALARGDLGSAIAYGEEALARATSIGSDVYVACALRVIGEARTRLMDLPAAAASLAAAEETQVRVDSAYDGALLLRAQALLAQAHGNGSEAQARAQAALESARMQRLPYLVSMMERLSANIAPV